MTLGKSGIGFLLRAFLADQLCERDSPNVDEDQLSGRTNVWWRIAWFFGSIIALFWLSYVPWKEKFMVSALVMGASLVFFLCGFKLYFYRRPTGSPLGMFGRVLKATVCKWHLGYPHSESEFNWQNKPRQRCANHKGEILLSPNVPLLRRLDKAAIKPIIEGTSSISQQEQVNLGNLCSVEQVEDEAPPSTRSYFRWKTWPAGAATRRHYARLEDEMDDMQSPPHVDNLEYVEELSVLSHSINEDEELVLDVEPNSHQD
ncbi:protein NRT1/ PTR FAMILY 5.4-like [Fagus crenata]